MLYRDDFDSSNIEAIAYEKRTQALYVTFKSAAVYRYESVPASVVTAFLVAPSKGKYFGGNIRNTYPTRRLDVEEIDQLLHLTRTQPLGESEGWLIAFLLTARVVGGRELLF